MAQEVELLVEEIQELTQVLRDLGRTVADVDLRIMEKFGDQVDKNTKSVKSNTGAVDDNTKSLKQSIVMVDKWGQEIKASAAAVEQHTEATKKLSGLTAKEGQQLERELRDNMRRRSVANSLFEEFDRGVSVTSVLKTQFENLGGTSIGATTALKMVTAVGEGLTNATVAMTKSLYKGERSASLTAKAFTELISPVAELATTVGTVVTILSLFGPAGLIGRGMKIFGLVLGAVGLTAKVAAKSNEIAAEQTDRLFKSFREISQFGIALTDGMDGVFDTMQLLGMTAAELDQFNELLTKNSRNLGLFAGTAGQGAKEFAKVAGGLYKSQLGYQLEMLGLSAQEQREAAMTYMSIQARTGQLQLKNTAKLIEESAKFAKELDLAAQLTGQTRKDQMAAREAALAEVRFRAALIDAERRGDVAETARLQTAQRAAALAKGFGDERGFTGILQAAAGRGALTTPEAVAAEMTYGISRILQQPNPTDAQLLNMMGKSVEVQQNQLAGINRYTGSIDALQTNFVATADLLKRQAVLAQAAAQAGFSGPDAISKFLETDQGKRMAGGGSTADMTRAGRLQQAAAMTMDSVVKSFNYAASLNKSASETFANAVDKFRGVSGAKKPVGGVPKSPGGFDVGAGVGRMSSVGAQPTSGDYLSKLSKLESNDRNIPTQVGGGTSSAFGLYQITKTTFDSLVANAGTNSPLKGKTFEDMKKDVALQKFAATALTEDNARRLAQRGLSSSDAAKYMSHVLGYPTAARVLEANAGSDIRSIVSSRAMTNNPSLFKGVSNAGDLRRKFDQVTGGAGYQFGGIASGPKSGYMQILHGVEAVVPLPNGRSIPVEMPDFASGMGKQMEAMNAQIGRLDEMVNLMRNQLSVSDKILKASQN
jgi:hypothetical protein